METSEQYLEATGNFNWVRKSVNRAGLFICEFTWRVHVDWWKAKYFRSNTPTFPFSLFAPFSHPGVTLSRAFIFLLSGKIPKVFLGADVWTSICWIREGQRRSPSEGAAALSTVPWSTCSCSSLLQTEGRLCLNNARFSIFIVIQISDFTGDPFNIKKQEQNVIIYRYLLWVSFMG